MPTPAKINIGKALKAKMQGRSYREIAAEQNVKPQSVHTAIAPLLQQLADPESLEQYRSRQADIIDSMAAKTLASITDTDYEKASLLQKTTAFCQLVDKSRLIQGQSTANYAVLHANAAFEAAAEWGDGHRIEGETAQPADIIE